jgi:hypothetical protein
MMARIVINDLKESVELDRAAMRRITGGWNRQRLGTAAAYESCLFENRGFLDHFNLAGFNFNLNRE